MNPSHIAFMAVLFCVVLSTGVTALGDVFVGEEVCGGPVPNGFDGGSANNMWLLNGANLNATTSNFSMTFLSGGDIYWDTDSYMICEGATYASDTWTCVPGTNTSVFFSGSRNPGFTGVNQTAVSDYITTLELSPSKNYIVAQKEGSSNGGYSRYGTCSNQTKLRSANAGTYHIDTDTFSSGLGFATNGIYIQFVLKITDGTLPPVAPDPIILPDFQTAYNTLSGDSFTLYTGFAHFGGNIALCDVYFNDSGVSCAQFSLYSGNNQTTCDVSFTGEKAFNSTVVCDVDTLGVFEGLGSTFIDNVNPLIDGATLDQGNNSAVDLHNNITGQFEFSDSNLWKLNVTLNGVELDSVIDLNVTHYLYNLSQNLSSFPAGTYDLAITMWDSHTARELRESYDIIKPAFGRSVEFVTAKNRIEIVAEDEDSLINPFTVQRESDKYNFTFKPVKTADFYRFTVTTDEPQHIIRKPESQYLTWIVSGNNWIDFYLPEEPFQIINIEPIDDFTSEVTIQNLNNPVIQRYASVGELNFVDIHYNLSLYNATLSYQPSVFGGQQQTTLLTIDHGIVAPSVSGTFTYDGSPKSYTTNSSAAQTVLNSTFLTPVVSASTTKAGLWSMTIEGNPYSFDFNQSVQKIIIDNCTEGNLTALNITMWLEDHPLDPTNGTLEGIFSYWVQENPANKANATVQYTNAHEFIICWYAENLTVETLGYLKYTADGGFTHRYYLLNYTLQPTSQDLRVYNYNSTTTTSDLKGITRYNRDYQYFKDIYVKLERYYPGTDIWRVVQMDKSGDFGTIFFNVQEENTDYQLRFYDPDGIQIKVTSTLKFVCDNGVCEPTFLLIPASEQGETNELIITSTFDNSTGIINITWEDPTALTGTVTAIVTKETMSSTITVCEESKTGSSGWISCDTSLYTGNFLVRVTATHSPEIYEYSAVYAAGRVLLGAYLDQEESALWSGGLMLMVGLAAFTNPIIGLIATMISIIGLHFLGLITILSIGGIIVVGALMGFIGYLVRN